MPYSNMGEQSAIDRGGFIGKDTILNKKGNEEDHYKKFWDGVDSVVDFQTKNSLVAKDQKVILNDNHISPNDFKKLGQLHLFSPIGRWKTLWDFLAAFTTFYAILEVPFAIAFIGTSASGRGVVLLNILEPITVSIFFLDIVLTFNTAYVDESTDILITDRMEIAISYARLWLWIDLVSSFPFASMINQSDAKNIGLLRLLRLLKIYRLYQIFMSSALRDELEKYFISQALISALILLLQVLVTAHIVACFWFYLTTFHVVGPQPPEGSFPAYNALTWTTQFGYEYADIKTQYIASLYWSMYTLLSIGFGNIYPVNTGERVFATLVMIVGAFISTGIILSMRDLLETQNLQSKEIRSKSAEFLEYVEQKKIPYQLKMEAKSAYSYYLQRRPTVAESDIFDELPKHVFLKMVKNLYRLDIQAIRLFHSTDEFFMAQLIIYSKPHHAVVGDIIYGMEDVADEISFVTRGAVGI
jgi:hypothetical protein